MQTHNHNRIYAPILVGLILLVGIFVTRPLYETYMNRESLYSQIEKQKAEKESVLRDLQTLQKTFVQNVSTGSSETMKKIKKIWKKWDTSDIMSSVMLNEFTRATSFSDARVSIGGISVDQWTRLPSGLSLWSVSFIVSSKNLDDMIAYITYLTQNSDYVFTIDEISLPIDTSVAGWIGEDGSLSLSLSLGIYYYE